MPTVTSNWVATSMYFALAFHVACTIGCQSHFDTNQIDASRGYANRENSIILGEYPIVVAFRVSVKGADSGNPMKGVRIYNPPLLLERDIVGLTDENGLLQGEFFVLSHDEKPYGRAEWREAQGYPIILDAVGYESKTIRVPRPSYAGEVLELGEVLLERKE